MGLGKEGREGPVGEWLALGEGQAEAGSTLFCVKILHKISFREQKWNSTVLCYKGGGKPPLFTRKSLELARWKTTC